MRPDPQAAHLRTPAPVRGEGGFSILEVLVVLVLVGVLAAIALPSFLARGAEGDDAAAKADARNAVTQVESCFAEEEDYASCEKAGGIVDPALADAGLPDTVSAEAGTGATEFVVQATSATGNTFRISRSRAGAYRRECDRGGEGGCPSTGRW